MSLPTDEELTQSTRDILSQSDLDSITFKIVMQVLQHKYGALIQEKRDFVREKVRLFMSEQQQEEQPQQGEQPQQVQQGKAQQQQDKQQKEQKHKHKHKQQELPQQPQSLSLPLSLSQPQHLKKQNVEEEVEHKERNEQEGEDVEEEEHKDKKKEEEPDLSKENLEVQKLLLESFKYGTRSSRRSTSATRTRPVKEKPKKRKKSDPGEDEGNEEESSGKEEKKKKKAKPKTNRPKILSPGLAEVVGESLMTRPEVVRRLHVYIKEHCQKDPKNGRLILLDEKLQQVFKKKKTDYFQMNQLLSNHLTDPGELM